MRLSGYQPQYFPRLHYFARALDSDIFEISDYLQFVRKHAYQLPDGSGKRGKSYQAHTPIKLHQGTTYLSIPTKQKGLFPINQIEIDYHQNWVSKHVKSIETGYSRAKNFKKIFPEVESILETKYKNLAQLNVLTILWGVATILGEKNVRLENLSVDKINRQLKQKHPFRLKKIVLMSETDITPPSKEKGANDWIIELCQKFGVNEYYYGGTAASAYMDFTRFKQAKIKLIEQDWKGLQYSQQLPKLGFIPNLSIIDLLINEGGERIKSVLQGK